MSKKHYVYIHKNPKTGAVFYIGKGKGGRFSDFKNRNEYWKSYVKKHGVVAGIFRDNMSEYCALTLEKILIGFIGKQNLCNLADGGRFNSGWNHSDESRAKISRFQKNKTPHASSLLALRLHRCKRPSDEARIKMSKAKKGIPRGPVPEHVRKKISMSHIGIRPSDEVREKLRLAKIGKRKREDNNKFDATVRVFEHKEHGRFVGCSYDLRHKYQIGAVCVRAIITGRQKTAKGWSYKGELVNQ
jgi:hypothetical protein